MLNEIIADLGDNYKVADATLLANLLDQVQTDALFISNRSNNTENVGLLKYEIEDCVKTIYLQRGAEDTTSLSQSGINATYKKAYETLRQNIISNGKRVIK